MPAARPLRPRLDAALAGRKYKDRGFEVVSICFDGQERRKQLDRIVKEINAGWITLAADDAMWWNLTERYSFSGWPQYLLLDRTGKVYAGTTEVNAGLPLLLEKMLTAEISRQSQIN